MHCGLKVDFFEVTDMWFTFVTHSNIMECFIRKKKQFSLLTKQLFSFNYYSCQQQQYFTYGILSTHFNTSQFYRRPWVTETCRSQSRLELRWSHCYRWMRMKLDLCFQANEGNMQLNH